jgi:hypothetical protein
MLVLSATCLAIALADQAGTLRFEEGRNARLEAMGLDGSYVAILDDVGLIEIADNMAAAEKRRDDLRARRA